MRQLISRSPLRKRTKLSNLMITRHNSTNHHPVRINITKPIQRSSHNNIPTRFGSRILNKLTKLSIMASNLQTNRQSGQRTQINSRNYDLFIHRQWRQPRTNKRINLKGGLPRRRNHRQNNQNQLSSSQNARNRHQNRLIHRRIRQRIRKHGSRRKPIQRTPRRDRPANNTNINIRPLRLPKPTPNLLNNPPRYKHAANRLATQPRRQFTILHNSRINSLIDPNHSLLQSIRRNIHALNHYYNRHLKLGVSNNNRNLIGILKHKRDIPISRITIRQTTCLISYKAHTKFTHRPMKLRLTRTRDSTTDTSTDASEPSVDDSSLVADNNGEQVALPGIPTIEVAAPSYIRHTTETLNESNDNLEIPNSTGSVTAVTPQPHAYTVASGFSTDTLDQSVVEIPDY